MVTSKATSKSNGCKLGETLEVKLLEAIGRKNGKMELETKWSHKETEAWRTLKMEGGRRKRGDESRNSMEEMD